MKKSSKAKTLVITILVALALLGSSVYIGQKLYIQKNYTAIGSDTPAEIESMTRTNVSALSYEGAAMPDLEGIERCADLRELSLKDSDIADLSAVKKLSKLSKLDLRGCDISVEQYGELADALPDCDILWEVPISGRRYSLDTEAVDLAEIAPEDYPLLAMLPKLTSADAQNVEITDALLDLKTQLTGCDISWTVDFMGETLDGCTEQLDYSDRAVDEAELRTALARLPYLKKLDLCGSGLTNEQFDGLIADYPDVKFVWLITMGPWTIRTDVTNFSTGHMSPMNKHIYAEDAQQLKYCTDLVALDIGHNHVNDLSFLAYLKKLRVFMCVDNDISDLSPLANCTELEYLEMWDNRIADISCLGPLEHLKEINISKNYYSDASPLYGKKELVRLWMGKTNVPKSQRQELLDNLPADCEVCFKLDQYEDPCANGWRPIDYRRWGFRYDQHYNEGMYDKQAWFEKTNRTYADVDPDAYGDE